MPAAIRTGRYHIRPPTGDPPNVPIRKPALAPIVSALLCATVLAGCGTIDGVGKSLGLVDDEVRQTDEGEPLFQDVGGVAYTTDIVVEGLEPEDAAEEQKRAEARAEKRAAEEAGRTPPASATGSEPGADPLADAPLDELLGALSELRRLEERPPTSLAALRRRGQGDVELFQRALRSRGYFSADVRLRIDRDAEPPVARITVNPGPRYRLADWNIDWAGGQPPQVPADKIDPEALGVPLGAAAEAGEVVSGERRLLTVLAANGYPFARQTNRRAVVDHDTREMAVTLSIDSGPFTRFGPTSVEGLDDVLPSVVEGKQPWSEGDTYDAGAVETYRADLLATGLFSSAVIKSPEQPTGDGSLPINLTVAEGPPRSIGAGARYSTDIGPELRTFWEHRNLTGRADRLRAELDVSPVLQEIEVTYRRPHPRFDRFNFGSIRLLNEDTDAFQQTGIETRFGQERSLGDDWRGSVALAPEYKIIDDEKGERTSYLLGLPVTLSRDKSDSLLDPRRGYRLSAEVTPYTGAIEDTAITFLRTELSGSVYVPLDDLARWVLAGRARIGSIAGASRGTLPADKRFYSGGGGSVRGYGYRMLGPLDGDDDPLGGRSVAEAGIELRVPVTDDIAVVPFLDAGQISEEPWPDLSTDVRTGAGLGLRYYTPLGPFRFDVAVPLDRRDADDPYQFYISLGQAF